MHEAFYRNIMEYFVHVQTVCTRVLGGEGPGEEAIRITALMKAFINACHYLNLLWTVFIVSPLIHGMFQLLKFALMQSDWCSGM